jgi:hypothetical protein
VVGRLRYTGAHRCQRGLYPLFSHTNDKWHSVFEPKRIGNRLTHGKLDRQSDSQTDALGAP